MAVFRVCDRTVKIISVFAVAPPVRAWRRKAVKREAKETVMLKKAILTVLLLTLAMVSAFAASHTPHHRMHHWMGMHHVRAYTRHMKSGKRVHVRGHYQH